MGRGCGEGRRGVFGFCERFLSKRYTPGPKTSVKLGGILGLFPNQALNFHKRYSEMPEGGDVKSYQLPLPLVCLTPP